MKQNNEEKKKIEYDENNIASREELNQRHRRSWGIFLLVFLAATVASFIFQQIASDPSLNIAISFFIIIFFAPINIQTIRSLPILDFLYLLLKN